MELPAVKIKKILYATDLSPNAHAAFAYALDLADNYGASLIILHILNELPGNDKYIGYYIGSREWDKIKAEREKDAREKLIGKLRDDIYLKKALHKFSELSRDKKDNSPGIKDEVIIERGDPTEQILKVAGKTSCDLIVMGNYGHDSLMDALVGNTTRKVLKNSPVPVLCVQHS